MATHTKIQVKLKEAKVTKMKVNKKGLKQKTIPDYFLPGQKYKTPMETDGLRKFYTSLLQQNPKSEMAKKWCLEHGLLPHPELMLMMQDLKKLSL
jgi:hypothetical protein